MTHPDLVVKARDSYVYAKKNATDKEGKGQPPNDPIPPTKHPQ
jgi:hypothetical protein